ncbi:ParB/Srx family N-terminal domain-containing protein [Paraburkholderia sediminicola]|uniref:ParB/Srx family N-terminal domain-containing protein n=1 Tax=Paraburkholderia sediminicola TaxID=458836 RepID=UPI0038BDBD74
MSDAPPWPADQVERWPLDRIIPDARNPRTHSDAQIAQTAASMQEWGWTNPVLVDEQGRLIAGHGRLLAARQLGLTDAPVMVARGWTDAQKHAYLIADNKLALNAGWDNELLAVEFDGLKEMDFRLELTGFSADELDSLLAPAAVDEPPEEFRSYDESIETEHQCPKCGYRWSGGT